MMRRSGVDQRTPVRLIVDGRKLDAFLGDTLAVALALAGCMSLRHSPNAGTPRGAFCYMGVCQECAVYVDGRLRQACLTPVADGMRVELRGVP